MEELKKYREFLSTGEQKAQEEFDKNVLWLSSCALGVSLTFLKELIFITQIESLWMLICAWGCWTLSIFAVFFSYHYSRLALKAAIIKIKNGTIYDSPVSNEKFAKFTKWLNRFGVIFLFAGIIFIILFLYFNLNNKGIINGGKKITTTTETTTTNSTPTTEGQRGATDGGFYSARSTAETTATIAKLNERLDTLEKAKYVSCVCKKPYNTANQRGINKTPIICNNRH